MTSNLLTVREVGNLLNVPWRRVAIWFDTGVWAAAHPEQIRTYRIEERRDKADRKQRRRAKRRAAQA